MVFNSAAFLFLFLPVSLLLFRLVPGARGKNILLCLLSAVFYAFGGLAQLPVLVLSAVWNYVFGRLLAPDAPRRKLRRTLAVAGDLALLGVYKYLAFLLSAVGLPALARPLALPLGISFFTFHAISYILDVYRERTAPEKRFDALFLYIAFFPRLIAGPIVAWHEAAPEIERHDADWEDTAAGLRRFVRGMAKKLLLSEGSAAVANAVFALSPESLGSSLAWAGAVAYCLQIFFDFSGYSDMAIGLGKCFGFTFPENFDYPYMAGTITEFWRRWHMTLNRWFVDYLYIPLGGSRAGEGKSFRNRMIVFFFTGLWHGAGWTFILWGLWHGLFVSLEGRFRQTLDRWREKAPLRVLLRIYTLLVVIAGFVMFRAATPAQGFHVLGAMFSFAAPPEAGRLAAEGILTADRIVWMGLGILFSFPVVPWALRKLETRPWWEIGKNVLALLGLIVCVLAISGGSFSPFIYQQF